MNRQPFPPRWLGIGVDGIVYGHGCSIVTAVTNSLVHSTATKATTKAAIDALNTFYDQNTGRWDVDGPWWQSGVALQAILDYMQKTGSRDYLSYAENTITIQRAPLAWWPSGGGDFRADSTDDTGWWSLALITMYQITGNSTYLDIAEEDEAYMYSFWNSSLCGGGIIQDIPERSYKNAISNELYLEVASTLYNTQSGNNSYLDRSLAEWNWFSQSGMINSGNLINDGLMEPNNSDSYCVNNNAPTWTYNQGVILGGLVQLSKATGDQSYMARAQQIANAVISSPQLAPNGTLTEPCEGTADGCDKDTEAFKGIFMRHLAILNDALDNRPYDRFIQWNAQVMVMRAKSSDNFYGYDWKGPFDTKSPGRQMSAVMLLVAALQQKPVSN